MSLQLEIAAVIALALVVTKLLRLLLLPRADELLVLLNVVAIVADVVMMVRIALLIHGQGLVLLVL